MAHTLSVIMPHRNHGRIVGRALEAVFTQSRPPDEVIVLDDASDDGSLEVLKGLRRRYPRLRLERNEANLGVIGSANRLMRMASGDFVFSTGADDRALPGLFERSMALLERHPQAGLCSGLAVRLDEQGDEAGPCLTPVVSPQPRYLDPGEVVRAYRRHGNWIVSYSVLYRRRAMLDIGGLEPSLGPSADGFAFQVLALRHGACFLPEAVAGWRDDPRSYARKVTADLDQAQGLVERCERLMTQRFPDLHPPEYMEAWKRRAALALIEGASALDPLPVSRIRDWKRVLAKVGLVDAAYFAALGALPALGRPLTKLYLYSQQSTAEQARILAGRIRGLWNGRGGTR